MSEIVETNRGGICGICCSEFVHGEPQFTHVGGEGHDGFHNACLSSWLRIRNFCPYDKIRIDQGADGARADRIVNRLKLALENAAYAAATGLAAAGLAVGAVGTRQLGRLAVDQARYDNIFFGVNLGGVTAIVLATFNLMTAAHIAIPVTALISGIATGVLSLIR